MTRAEIRAWESRWAVPTAVCAFLGPVLLIGSTLIGSVSGEGNAEVLRSVHAHSGSIVASGAMQAVAFLLIALPLVYLFRLVSARSDRVKRGLIGLVVAAPIFLAVSGGLSAAVRNEAADQLIGGEAKSTLSPQEAKEECVEERKDEGAEFLTEEYEPAKGETALAACESRKREDDRASNALSEASLTPIVSGLGIAGTLGFIVALFYSCLWGLRTGVLTRFWGTLGMVAGIALVLGPLVVIALAWFLYFGLLTLGAVPGGQPPAWEAGEAVPWPTPGERAAAELEPSEGPEGPEGDGAQPGPEDRGPSGPERRKRKQRDPDAG